MDRIPYNDKLSVTFREEMEKKITEMIVGRIASWERGDQEVQTTAYDILYTVLREFRPDLFGGIVVAEVLRNEAAIKGMIGLVIGCTARVDECTEKIFSNLLVLLEQD